MFLLSLPFTVQNCDRMAWRPKKHQKENIFPPEKTEKRRGVQPDLAGPFRGS